MSSRKVYVQVLASFDTEGTLMPVSLTWENGRRYEIERVTDVRPAAATKAGGQGDRYTIRVDGQESFLFFEHSEHMRGSSLGRWFVERRTQS